MSRKPFNFIPGGRTDREAGTATKLARTSHARDIDRQASPVSGFDTDAADVALSLRTVVSSAVRALKPAKKAKSALNKAERGEQRHRHFQERVCQTLDSQRARARMAEVSSFLKSHAGLAHLHSWASAAVVFVLAVAMLVNDPATVYTSVRVASDVPESVGTFDVSNPSIAAALAAAVGISAVLLGAALGAGKALATFLFRGRLLPKKASDGDTAADSGPEFPAAVASHRLMGTKEAFVVLIICSVLLAVFVAILHSFAEARFITDSQTAKANAMVVFFVTSLPFGVVLFETVAAAPQFEHLRRVGRWAMMFRIAEWIDVARDQRHLRRAAAGRRAVNGAVIGMADVITDVGHRSLAEVAEASMTTGKVSMEHIADAFKTNSTLASPSGKENATTTSDYSGVPATPYLPGLPAASNLVADVLKRHQMLEATKIPERSLLAAVWHDFRAAPETYCAVEPADEAGTSQPTSMDGHQSARERIHGVPNSAGDTTADESAA